MATRRSRLQIKPNILGGPKGPSTKPVPKTSGKASSNEGTVTAKSDTSNKVKSPTRLTSPRRNINVNPLKDASTESVEKDKKCTEKEAETISSLKNEDKSVPENEAEKSVNEDSKSTADKTDIPELPTRAGLRKFGKVNISAARSVISDSLPAKDGKKLEIESSAEKLTKDSPKATDVPKEGDSTVEKKSSASGSSQSSSTTVVQRRSRFPKAKPNIAEAGRRKQKENSSKDSVTSSSAADESSEKIPEITVTDSSACENYSQSGSKKQEISEPPDVPHTQIKIQPRLSATPTPVTKSPLKHPTPTIPLSPEKRARTLSTSEPPVVKRQRKPKVDAPTDKPPDRATMKMKDLIRWNPTNNPMKPKFKNTDIAVSSVEKENIGSKASGGGGDTVEETATEADDTALPVPQVTIGPDGNIVINEKSLIVKGPDPEKAASQEDEVIDETDLFTTYNSFRKRNMSKRWSKKETKKFYRALAMIGIDFFLISQLFPDRTRFDIKKKFKKEEKVNRALVEKVLKERIQFDPAVFESQEKEEDSTDEEEEEVKLKGKRGRKKKEGKNTENESKSQQKPAKKKVVKRKKMPLNYYEDYTTEEEEEPVQKKSNSGDCPWQPPSVSQKDGEVVGILMDMSEGRITGEGQGQENVMNVMGVNEGTSSDKLVAVPLRKVNKGGSFIPIEPKNMAGRSHSEGQYSTLSSANSKRIRSVPAIPGIQSISIMETQQALEGGEEPGPSTMKLPVQNQASASDRQIILPIFNKSSAVPQTNLQQNVSLYNPQVQYNQSVIPNNEVMASAGSSSSQLQPGTSENQLQQFNQIAVSDNQDISEEADRYVLVTLMPEGGGETVIHIYRMHGGAQSQNQILYADPFASQQITLESTSINNSIIQSQNSTDVQNIPPNEISETLPPSDLPLDYSLANMAQSGVHEITNEDTMQLNTQETVDDRKSVAVSQSDIQVNITGDIEPELKDEIPVQLTYEPVSSDLTPQSSFTQLIPHESTCSEDSKSNLTLTSEDSKPDIYINVHSPRDSEYKSELEYEVENC